MEKPIVLLSGGFDPYHDGHAKMFARAAEIGDICVILNSDDWLINKKGKAFMSLIQRADVLNSVRGVEWIWHSETLGDVSNDIIEIHNHLLYKSRFLIFAKGGDRTAQNTPEQAICEKLGIPVLFGLGGSKTNSSSELLNKYSLPESSLSNSTLNAINGWSANGSMA